MPLQVGTMMVVVRAQDFASRTLRRVGAEMSGLSRTQRIQAMREMTMYQKSSALSDVAIAESNMRRLAYVREAAARQASLVAQTQAMDRYATAQSRVMKGGRFKPGIKPADIREFQNAAAAIKSYGLEGVMAARRLNAARSMIAERQRVTGKGPTKMMARELANAERAVKSLGVAGEASAARFARLNRQVANFDNRLQGMPGWLQRATRSTAAYGDALYRANRQLEKAYMNLSNAQRAELAFNNAMRAMPAQRLADIGHALSGIGRTMQLIGLIGTGILAAASNSFANFNQQLMVAATQTVPIGAGIAQITENSKALNEEILNLMTQFPATAEEMAKSAYDIYSSMDVSFSGGLDLLKKFNQLSVATLTDLQTATNAGITVLNNFGGTSKSINESLNLMVATVRFGRMRLEDFNNMLNKVAPAAASAGQSLEDVAGAMALITTRQPSQRQVATGIARLFQVFQDPDFQQGIRDASNGVVDIVKEGGGLKPLPIIVNDLAKAFEEVSTKKGAAQLFRELTAVGRGSGRGLRSTIEAQRAWTFLFKNLQDYNMLQFKTTKDSKEFARSLKAMSESPGVRWQVFINQMRMLVLVIGEKAIPVFLKIGDAVSKAIQWFRNLSDSTKGTIISFATWGSVATLLAGVILGIAGPIVALLAHMKAWRTSTGEVTARVITLGAAFRAIPFVAITLILKQFVGMRRAIEIMILGWVAWKVAAVTAAGMAAAAHIGAAAAVKLAWRRALASTGVGLLVVAFGLAAEWVIIHWDKVKKWFSDFWTWLQITAYEVALRIGRAFDFLPGSLGQKFTDMRQNAEEQLGKLKLAQSIKKETAQTQKEMDKFLKSQPKKFREYRKSLMEDIKGAKPGSMLKESLKEELKNYNDALKRMRQAKKKFEAEGFSEEFWSVLGAKNAEDFSKQLDKMYRTQVDGANEAIQWQKELTNTQKQAADQAVDTLRGMYMQMEQENRGFFGSLFQGPWLTSETFDLAKEWGITPRIQDMIRDLHEQNAQFARWRSSLDKVLKKGLPTEFVNELRQMGPEQGQPLLDQIMSAKPGQVNKLISEWKRREGQIKSATKMDFSREINAFKKAGGDMGQAMINGFEQAGVSKWFDTWVKTTFPEVINAAVATAVADWKAQNPKPPSTKPDQKPQAPKTTPKTEHNDNSKSVTVNVRMQDTHDRRTTPEEEVRKIAFIAQNVVRGWL